MAGWMAIILGAVFVCTLVPLLLLDLAPRPRHSARNAKNNNVPDHVWTQLSEALSAADYNYLRATYHYLGTTPNDLLSRLNYIGSMSATYEPNAIKLAILELRLGDFEHKLSTTNSRLADVSERVPSEAKIIWLAISSVSAFSSLAAFLYYILDKGKN